MDRDPSANHLDSVERVSPSTGANDTGETGSEAERIYRERDEGKKPKTTVNSRQDGEDPEKCADTLEEIRHPGVHGPRGTARTP